MSFRRSKTEATLYVKGVDRNNQLVVSIYVDNLLVTGGDLKMLMQFKQHIVAEFEMSDLGKMTYFIGIEVKQLDDEIFLFQKKYA